MSDMTSQHLMALGCGYTARRMGKQLLEKGWLVSGTSRQEAGAERLGLLGIQGHVFDGTAALPEGAFDGVTHILVSIPPSGEGDMSLEKNLSALADCKTLQWVGILSTTGVYGDAEGAWIDESYPPAPLTAANEARLEMENDWLAFGAAHDVAVQVFRLPGIYGAGRSVLGRLRMGRAMRIIKEGQVFNRIHVDDIIAACRLGMARPEAGPVFHIADGAPAAAEEVTAYGAELLGLPVPPAVPINEAGLPPMALHFYAECKRLDISKARKELGFEPLYPSYREGLAAILEEEEAR